MKEINNEISAVEAAQNKIESIRRALINGDAKLTAADLAAARSELEFAELKTQAATVAEEKAAATARRANLLELQKELAAVNDSRVAVDKKFTAFEKSLADYLSTAANYQNALNGIRTSLQSAGIYPRGYLELSAGIPPADTVPGIPVTDERRVLSIGETSAEGVLPGEAIKPLVERVLGEYERHF